MVFLEVFLRSAASVLALLCAGLLLVRMRTLPASKWAAVFLLSVAAGAVIHTADGIAPPSYIRAALLPLSAGFIVFLWIAARAYFDDDFKPGVPELLVAALWFALLAADYGALANKLPTEASWAGSARHVLSYLLVAHLVYAVTAGAGPDLVEARRRSRKEFTFCVLALYVLNKAVEVAFGYSALPLWFTALLYGLIAALLVRTIFGFTVVDERQLGRAQKQQVATAGISPSEKSLFLGRLTQLVERDQVYLEPDLSVGDLAARIGTAEHKLRALINQEMGFRNFRSYLNGYRVRHAIELLSANGRDSGSIATIAMNSGFGSLASFNRIFKSHTGATPRAFQQSGKISDPLDLRAENSPHFQK
ncbi:MAG: AraC family transcriptional regulator [Pseudomonadota bacterium]